MLKKIIKTHTARLDFVDIIKPTFLRNAVTTNRQRRVIASLYKISTNPEDPEVSILSPDIPDTDRTWPVLKPVYVRLCC